MKFACPECAGHILADASALGATVECPHCGKGIGLVELNLVASTNDNQVPARSGSQPVVVAQPSAETPPSRSSSITADQWFLSQGGRQFGPYSEEQLVQYALEGKIDRASMLWKDGMKNWVPASAVDGLFPPVPPVARRMQGPVGMRANRAASATGRGVLTRSSPVPEAWRRFELLLLVQLWLTGFGLLCVVILVLSLKDPMQGILPLAFVMGFGFLPVLLAWHMVQRQAWVRFWAFLCAFGSLLGLIGVFVNPDPPAYARILVGLIQLVVLAIATPALFTDRPSY